MCCRYVFDYVKQRTIANSIIFYSSLNPLPIYCRPIDNEIQTRQLLDSLLNVDKIQLKNLVFAESTKNYTNISMRNMQTKQIFILNISYIIRYFINIDEIVTIESFNITKTNESIQTKFRQIFDKYRNELSIFAIISIVFILIIIIIVMIRLFYFKD